MEVNLLEKLIKGFSLRIGHKFIRWQEVTYEKPGFYARLVLSRDIQSLFVGWPNERQVRWRGEKCMGGKFEDGQEALEESGEEVQQA